MKSSKMKSSKMVDCPITPAPGYVVVEIVNKYESGLRASDEKFDYIGEGRVASAAGLFGVINEERYKYLAEKILVPNVHCYFEPVPVSEIIDKGDRRYAVVKTISLKGVDND